MFRFTYPKPDGSVYDLAIGASNIADAFRQFLPWWTPDMVRAIGVWQNAALEARIIPVTNRQTGELEPHLRH